MEDRYAFWILQKDVLITVEGYFKPEEWTDSKSGEKRNRIVMVATKFYPAPEKKKKNRISLNRRLSLKRKKQANDWSGLVPLFLLHIRECFCVHAVFFPTLPFIGMTVLIPGLPVVIRYAADYGQTRKEKFQTWAGLQWSSSGASALPKQPPSSVLQPRPFTVCPGSPLLTRSPLPLVAGR